MAVLSDGNLSTTQTVIDIVGKEKVHPSLTCKGALAPPYACNVDLCKDPFEL